MSTGLLPASLLCAAGGLLFGLAPRRGGGLALAACVLGALAGALALPAPDDPASTARLGAWVTLAATAAAVILPRGAAPGWLTILLGLNAGVWAGALTGPDLAFALPWVLLAASAAALARGGPAIAVRVVASWLLTIGMLNAAIPILVPTPGYVRDHLG